MSKLVVINQCNECPNHIWTYEWSDDVDDMVVKSSYCKITGKELDKRYTFNFKLASNMTFPTDCRLPDVRSE